MSRNGLIAFGLLLAIIIGVAATGRLFQTVQHVNNATHAAALSTSPDAVPPEATTTNMQALLPSPIATAEAAVETPEHEYVRRLTNFASHYAEYEANQTRVMNDFNMNCIPLMFKITDADRALADAEEELKTFETFSRGAEEELKPTLENVTAQLRRATEQLRLIRSLAKQSRTQTTPVTLPGRRIDDGRDTH